VFLVPVDRRATIDTAIPGRTAPERVPGYRGAGGEVVTLHPSNKLRSPAVRVTRRSPAVSRHCRITAASSIPTALCGRRVSTRPRCFDLHFAAIQFSRMDLPAPDSSRTDGGESQPDAGEFYSPTLLILSLFDRCDKTRFAVPYYETSYSNMGF